MTDPVKLGSSLPLVPLRRADDLVDRIVALKADADVRGFGTLAYFLEMARTEAQIQAGRIDEERETASRKPEAMWRPLEE